MKSFEIFGVGRIRFGAGCASTIGEAASAMGRRALVVHNGLAAARLAPLLERSGVDVALHRFKGEPTAADVDLAVMAARREQAELIVGIGGGSAIDCAKAVAGIYANGGAAVDYMEVVGNGQKITRPALPWIAIPTTAGTGAEATRNAVISLPEQKFKASIRSELLLPRLALIDAELGVDVPADVTAASGMDAVCQLIESYISANASPFTDALALQGLVRAARSLQRAVEAPADVEARADMALAALFSGVALSHAGLGAAHGFAAPLGANFPAPHGVICAALLPHVLAANARAGGGNRYADLSAAAGQDIVEWARRMNNQLAIPALSRYGVGPADVVPMAQLARKASSMKTNPVALSDEALQGILRAAAGL